MSRVPSVMVFSAIKDAVNNRVLTILDHLTDLALKQKENESVEHIYLLVGIFFIPI